MRRIWICKPRSLVVWIDLVKWGALAGVDMMEILQPLEAKRLAMSRAGIVWPRDMWGNIKMWSCVILLSMLRAFGGRLRFCADKIALTKSCPS